MTEEIKIRCEICDRSFNSQESIGMHNKAKHSSSKEEQKITKSTRVHYKKIRNYGIFILIFGFAVWGVYALMTSSNSYNNLPASEINIGSHKNIALHIHSDLKILINGNETLIPANIGIAPGIMRPLHKHDATEEIHIEGPYKRDFTIGEFFQIWGRIFNSNCIFEYCIDKGELKMLVNGQENSDMENYLMKDHDKILIEYNSF